MIASSKTLNLRREVDSDSLKLANGRYAIVPCTKNAGEMAEFSIDVYYDCSHEEITVTKVPLHHNISSETSSSNSLKLPSRKKW